MPAIYRSAAARRDLVEHYVYLAENAGPETADRFLTCAQSSFEDLARRPAIGAPLKLRNPALSGTRKWAVKGFHRFLIFYMPSGDGVTIMRVLHAAQDWWHILGMLDE
ncbi:type II toxin-antitoxin system RelE/ParE family toxin [Trinickia symbiotica]|uniref:Type II toxin-antitoxin system RelE/ParE family toxin n=1 Tax=Trinickia symbiotica TaxID=863227 RepID=A0A2T3XMR1_9BURK|nr:type II toxin-antitoxin system RelE/ParE family toxin [Trinickia symbiotica]PTB17778.1 type II toxin-antitoxin system RelE/ParE family toxin [Trinickia symbiotica]